MAGKNQTSSPKLALFTKNFKTVRLTITQISPTMTTTQVRPNNDDHTDQSKTTAVTQTSPQTFTGHDAVRHAVSKTTKKLSKTASKRGKTPPNAAPRTALLKQTETNRRTEGKSSRNLRNDETISRTSTSGKSEKAVTSRLSHVVSVGILADLSTKHSPQRCEHIMLQNWTP